MVSVTEKCEIKKWKCIITQLSMCSFGIYLLHRPLQIIIIRQIEKIGDRSTEAVVNAIGTYLLSFGIVWLICRLPYCGKILFMYKENSIPQSHPADYPVWFKKTKKRP